MGCAGDSPPHSLVTQSMAFDLKRVLKVMLFASNGPLSVKDIQTAVSRFHEQATALPLLEGTDAAAGAGDVVKDEEPAPYGTDAPASVEAVLPAPEEDDEFYRDVPTLIP